MGYMKELFTNAQNICDVCDTRECKGCKISMKIVGHTGKKLQVLLKGTTREILQVKGVRG